MRIPRLYISQQLKTNDTLTVSGKPAHHVTHVLRLRTGATLYVFDGKGHEYKAVLDAIGRNEINIKLVATVVSQAEPALNICLVQGIARNDRMDLILQKSVELGISSIYPLWMQRSQSHLTGERLEKRIQHWQGTITSACEQCGRATLPALFPPTCFPDWITTHENEGIQIMLQPESTQTLAGLSAPEKSVTLLVGPEGGLNTEEQTLALATGFTGIRLGQRILRTETAALTALVGIQTLWGDFR